MISFNTNGYKNHFRPGHQKVGPEKFEKIRGILNPKTWFKGAFGAWKYGFMFNEGGWPLNMTVSISHPTARERNATGSRLYVFFFGLTIYHHWGD